MGIKEFARKHIRSAPEFLQRMYFYAVKRRGYKIWVAEGKPMPACSLVKWSVIEGYKKRSGFKTFIETGTYLGDTVFEALRHFDKIYSIELDMDLYKKARKRFRKHQHVELLQGDSGKVLSSVLEKVTEPAIFWLDGHYSGDITARGELDCPVFQELEAIFKYDINHILLLDDARHFLGVNGYPTISQLEERVRKNKPASEIKVENDIIAVVLK